jgi:hypothetical protein
MSTQLAINDFDSAINAVSSIEKLAIIMLKNPHYKILGEAGVYAILFAAKATNVDPFHALNGGFNYIKGKVAMSTELQVAKIRGAGHSVWIRHERCNKRRFNESRYIQKISNYDVLQPRHVTFS